MLKVLFDQNFNHRILRGLRQRVPDLDAVTTQTLNKEKEIDPELLRLAFSIERVVITHDQQTFPKYAYERLIKGSPISGLIVVPNNMPIGLAITDLELLVVCSLEREFDNRIDYLPIK